jgi:hypothetical protein
MTGKFDLVRNILTHVAKCIVEYNERKERIDQDEEDEECFTDGNIERLIIPSTIIRRMLKEAETKETTAPAVVGARMRTLFDKFASAPVEETETKVEEEKKEEEEQEEMPFREVFKILKENLPKMQLPDLTSADQVTLTAVVDTLWQIPEKPTALDDRGIRYLVAVKIDQNLPGEASPIKSPHVMWALNSDSQETLWKMVQGDESRVTWDQLKNLGLVFWMRNPNTLREICENLAKEQFRVNQNPTQSALLYLALKKKTALVQLFRAKDMGLQADFFTKDFKEPKNIISGEKNALRLVGKQEFEYAAAFYLLIDKPDDAIIKILVKKRQDYFLAYLISRLYCGDDSEFTNNLLREQ